MSTCGQMRAFPGATPSSGSMARGGVSRTCAAETVHSWGTAIFEAGAPCACLPAHDVAVPVGKQRRQPCAFDAPRDQKRTAAGDRVRNQLTCKAHLRKRQRDLLTGRLQVPPTLLPPQKCLPLEVLR